MSWNIQLPDAQWYGDDDPRLDGLVREVRDQDVVAIDTETTGLKIWKDKVLFWSMAWGEDRRVCMPFTTLKYFWESFEDSTKRWVFANAKYDMHMLANMTVRIAGDCVDTAVMHALLNEEKPHGLKDMAADVLKWSWSDFFDTFRPQMLPDSTKMPRKLAGGGMSQPTRRETVQEMLMRCYHEDLPRLVDYASNDAYGTLRVYEALKKELERTVIYSLYPQWLGTMADLFFLTEVPFTKVLWKCERNGVFVNREYLQNLRIPMWKEHEDLCREMQGIWTKAGLTGQFNPNSIAQLRTYFFDMLGARPLVWTNGGKSGIRQPSVDKGFLEHYEHELPMASHLLRDRKLTKLVGTYIDGADEHIDDGLCTGTPGRIHTRFNQDVARTGRLSSSDPNLQNIPQPDKDKFQLRGAFQATPGHELIVGDYSQLEMRLLACATVTDDNPDGAAGMIKVFLDGKDIHMGNAEMVFGPIYKKKYGFDLTYDFLKQAKKTDGLVKEGKLPPEARTAQIEHALFARNAIKSVGFGLNYGMKESKLARQLGISKEEALDIIKAYLGAYPAVKNFYDAAIAETQKTGFSFTLLGRRRFHPMIGSPNATDRWSEERKAVNNPIQGTAADAVRMAMLKIDAADLETKYGCKMVLQVHDELAFECPKETAEAARDEIKNIMEHPFPTDLIVPLDVSIGIGSSWNKAK